MTLLANDLTYLEGRDVELVTKELAVADSKSNQISSYVFKTPYSWEEVPRFNARMNCEIDYGCNLNDGDIFYSKLESILKQEASSNVTI